MLYIYCPYCKEWRDEQEFHYAGEAFIERSANPEEISDEAWGDYVFFRKNPKGITWEQWVHGAGCRKYFIVKRDNVSNEIFATYTMAEGKAAYLAELHAQQEGA